MEDYYNCFEEILGKNCEEKKQNIFKCKDCNVLLLSEDELNYSVCPNCGRKHDYMFTNDDDINDKSCFKINTKYDNKNNYLKNIIFNINADKSIPQNIYDKIICNKDIKYEQININGLKKMFKKYNIRKYEYLTSTLKKILRIQNPTIITNDLQKKIIEQFNIIMTKIKRNRMPSYSYLINKIIKKINPPNLHIILKFLYKPISNKNNKKLMENLFL